MYYTKLSSRLWGEFLNFTMNIYDIKKGCSTCKNRELTDEGYKCSLTKEKPLCEADCENYVTDYVHIAEVEDGESIHGWLVVFLWLGIGAGVLLSVLNFFVEMHALKSEGALELSILLSSLLYLEIGVLVVTGILTIIAFYKRKDNAVSLAMTYIAMIVLNGIYILIIGNLSEDNSIYPSAIRQFVWGGVWFAYLMMSSQVKAVIPKATRVWKSFEKVLIAIYLFCMTAIVGIFVYTSKSENPRNFVFSDESYIRLLLDGCNEGLPMTVDDDLVLEQVVCKDDNTIEYIYYIENECYSDSNVHYYQDLAIWHKQQFLFDLAKEPYDDPGLTAFIKEGCNVAYRFNDAYSKTLYTITITPDEFNKVASERMYKSPVGEFQGMISRYNQLLPDSWLGGTMLDNICLDNGNMELVYEIQLPDMSIAELSDITSDYLTEYIEENWEYLHDALFDLAMMNQMAICFDFKTYYGNKYTRIRFSPEQYNAFEY